MKPVRSDSVTDQVYRSLNQAIESGRFKPGARIFEEALARELGTSKMPLRLALHQLRRDGVVRIEPRKGIYLAVPSPAEIIELIELREVLEGLAARRAALQPNREHVILLEDCLAGFNKDTLAEHRLEYAAADHRFHTILVQASASSELTRTLQVINIRLHQHRIGNQVGGHDLQPIHHQHLAIIMALKAGNAAKSEELARSHVRHQLALMMLKENESAAARTNGPQRSNPADGTMMRE